MGTVFESIALVILTHLVVLQFPTMCSVVIYCLLILLNVSVKFEFCFIFFSSLYSNYMSYVHRLEIQLLSHANHVKQNQSKSVSIHSCYNII